MSTCLSKRTFRVAAVATAVTAVVASLAVSASVSATAVSTGGEKAPLAGARTAPEGSPLAAITKAYQSAYPTISKAQATKAAQGTDARQALKEALFAGDSAKTLGGAWYDAPTDTFHVSATTAGARTAAASLGKKFGVAVSTHTATRTFTELQAQADQLRGGAGALGKAAAGNVGIDVAANSVVAAVPEAQAASLSKAATGVKVVAAGKESVVEDAGCTARDACDYTIRAGAMLWRTSQGNNVCSVGFTGRQTNNARWVYTAGHCSNGNNVTWGTGAKTIGPMYASINSGVYDAAIIRVTNSWFTGDQGGEIYKSVYVNGVAPTLGYMLVGETVCLSANYTNPTGPNFCGVIGSTSDAGTRGMVRVNGLDACGGDSGGGWYWLSSSGRRIGYGLHSRSNEGCHGDAGGNTSWFSPLPTVKTNWTPWLNVEVRP